MVDTPELRAAYNENQPKVTEFWTALAQNEALFDKYKALHASPDFAALSPARKKIIENALRDFRLGGAELPDDKKARFAEIQEQHAALSTRFSENVLDATNDYELLVENEAELAGLPDDVKQAARAAADKDGKHGLAVHAALPVLLPGAAVRRQPRAARDHLPRQRHQGVRTGRASRNGTTPPTSPSCCKLRDEEAKLLGYRNFAEVSLVPKMARDAAARDRVPRRPGAPRPSVRREGPGRAARLRPRANWASTTLEAWDMTYASEKLREQRYAFSEQEVKQYFPEPNVVDGLFRAGADAVRRARSSRTRRRSGTRTCVLPHRARRPAGRPVLPRPVRAHRQARRRLDGRCARPPPGRRRHPDAGRLPDLQLHRRRRSTASCSPRCSRTTK